MRGSEIAIQGVLDFVEMSSVLAAASTDVLARDATDVMSAAKVADSGFGTAVIQDVVGLSCADWSWNGSN